MSYIQTVAPEEATGECREMYERQRAHYGYVPNYAGVFSHRPEIMRLWAALQSGIRRPMERKRFELATFAAARVLRSTYCSLAHGRALLRYYPPDVVRSLIGGDDTQLAPADAAVVRFAEAIARDASAVQADDVAALREHGLTDAEIFDVAATAAGRAFFTKIVDGLGAAPDAELLAAAEPVSQWLSRGRRHTAGSEPAIG